MESTASFSQEATKDMQSTELLQETLNGLKPGPNHGHGSKDLEQYTSTALQSAAKAIQDSTFIRNPGQSTLSFSKKQGLGSVHFK